MEYEEKSRREWEATEDKKKMKHELEVEKER